MAHVKLTIYLESPDSFVAPDDVLDSIPEDVRESLEQRHRHIIKQHGEFPYGFKVEAYGYAFIDNRPSRS